MNMFRKFSKRTKIVLIVANLIIMGALIGFAVMQITVPGTAVVTGGSIELYTTVECTTPLTSVDFGSFAAGGQSAPKYVYVKNVGNVPINVSSEVICSDPAITLNLESSTLSNIPAGQCTGGITLVLNATADAIPGSVGSIQIKITGTNN